jgi:uncharacterized membrane protein
MFLIGVVLPVAAIAISLWAVSQVRARHDAASPDERIAALEEQVRGLLYRVWTLEQGAHPAAAPSAVAGAPPSIRPSPAPPPPGEPAPEPVRWPAPQAPVPPPPSPVPPAPAPAPSLDLEQRIGARWATWVGIVAILFAVSFFLKWAFDNNYLGPGARVTLGLVAGLVMLAAGFALHRRQDVPYLSEGLAGGGLGVLYLSLWGAHALYGLLGPGPTFAAMFAVTVLGALVSVASSRQITAVLTVLGGLLTPVLITVEQPDERKLFTYLLVLDILVLGIARYRTWPALNRLAWGGTALLVFAALAHEPTPAYPLSRLLLLSALFLLFVAVPLLRERAARLRLAELDLLLVVTNAAGYFWAVYTTLEPWQPRAEGPYALALAVLYRLVSADYASRVRDDEATVVVHEGVAWTFLTIAIPLALDGHWVTLAWAVQGLMLLWAASRIATPVAAWGGLAALLLAAVRVVALDRYWYPGAVPVWNLTYLIHLLVVLALVWGGVLAASVRPERLGGLTVEGLRSTLWLVAALTLAVLFWREPSGLWPATLLTAELVALGWLARVSSAPAFVVAAPLAAAIVLVRVLGADDGLARRAAESLLTAPLLSRIAACAALGVAGAGVARSAASTQAPVIGRTLSGAAGIALLYVLSAQWILSQNVALREARDTRQFDLVGQIRWQTHVGLSVLWTLYAASALAWGFIRSSPAVRYAALLLFGITVGKIFVFDLSAVKTVYRILSFLVLGVVLLGVSAAYQKVNRQRVRRPAV